MVDTTNGGRLDSTDISGGDDAILRNDASTGRAHGGRAGWVRCSGAAWPGRRWHGALRAGARADFPRGYASDGRGDLVLPCRPGRDVAGARRAPRAART